SIGSRYRPVCHRGRRPGPDRYSPVVTRVRLLAAVGLGPACVAMSVRWGAARAGAETVVAIPASVDATGARDVTQELNTVIATAPAGATVRFPTGGRFRVDGIVFVSGRHDVSIDGQGSTLVAPTDGSATP